MKFSHLLERLRPSRPLYANIYDICDPVLLSAEPETEPGRNLVKFYRTAARHPLLKAFVLRGCRHPGLPLKRVETYRLMMAQAVAATPEDWTNPGWIRAVFAPLAELLDQVQTPAWQRRDPVSNRTAATQADVDEILERVSAHIHKVWGKQPHDPYFPLYAQPVLSGDETMNGENFLDILCGLGSYEYQNATLVFGLVRAFLMNCPSKLALMRAPYDGQAEPLRLPLSWIRHRTAFYDVIFAELVLARLRCGVEPGEAPKLEAMVESLLRYVIVTSSEPLESPGTATPHPGLSCLPMDDHGQPLCQMSAKDWKIKQDLGFADYLPDVDTTFLGLSLARQWLDYAGQTSGRADPELLRQCEEFLDHPWVEIVAEYQYGSPTQALGCTNKATAPLDYHGAVGLWLERPFAKDSGQVVRQALGNDMCPGHNMDIFESILANREQWNALQGENLATLQRFLEFHRKAFESGNFARESAIRFYLPATYVFYAGRAWRTFKAMSGDEQRLVDPGNAMDAIRNKALDYVKNDLLARTANPFDAALGVSALVLLEYEPKDDGLISHGLGILKGHLGEGLRTPYRGYEWTLVRHPTRILVGSPVATSLFVLGACAEGRKYLYEE